MDRVTGVQDAGPVSFINDFYKANETAITAAAAGIASMDSKSLETAISTFDDTAKVMMKGLSALGEIHPAIGGEPKCVTCLDLADLNFYTVAVLAFKVVVSLDLTRRANNKKVIVLKLQMQDMMAVLFQ